MARKFGAAKGSGGRYVCDLVDKLALGVRQRDERRNFFG